MTPGRGTDDVLAPKAGLENHDPRRKSNKVILRASAALLVLGVLTVWNAIAYPVWLGVGSNPLPTIFLGALFAWCLCVMGVALSQGRWWMLVALPFVVSPVVLGGALFISCGQGRSL